MTLYITFIRAWSLHAVASALKIKTKSPCQVLRDLAGFTAFFSVLQSVLFFILFPLVLPHWLDLPPYILLIWGAIICCVTWIIIEVILATFVLVQLRRQSINRSRSSTVSLDFERLVALVALVFCCNLIVNVIDYGSRLAARDELDIWRGRWVHWSAIASLLNSSVNLFVYLLASFNFRVGFIRLGQTIFSMCF